MKILITGTRAPVALDLIRALKHQGHEVYSADSMYFPLSRASKCVQSHSKLPSPNRDLQRFKNALIHCIEKYNIDILVPTCEEIFFISRFYDELKIHCQLFLEPLEKLAKLHNKFEIQNLAKNCNVNLPETILLTSDIDKKNLPKTPIVLKPVFSRFASHLKIKPSLDEIENLSISVPYVAQAFIEGTECCVYALAHHGKLISYAAYHPSYTAGLGAGIYFEPAKSERIKPFLESFIKKMNFTGQLSFDFIENEQGLFLLECNPRATSGLHLLAEHVNWQQVFSGIPQNIQLPNEAKMLKFAMLSYGLKVFFSKNRQAFLEDYKRATDVLNQKNDGWIHLKSIVSIAEILSRAIRFKKTFKDAATDDIEWNGEPL